MRALKKTREIPSRLDGSFESLLAQFSATTLELNPSLGTSEFARRLTARASEMLNSRAAVLVLARGSEWVIAALSGPAHQWDPTTQHRVAAALAEQARVPAVDFRGGSAMTLLGRELGEAIGWGDLLLARLTGSEGELLGVLCLVELTQELSPTERQLLEALAGHASVALENVRLFSRIEQSRKQWVEDFDAISDFIVVHDVNNRVLRLNRALAELLKVRPTEAVGRDIGKM
jgi:GAF domain-containing protein